MRTLTPEQQKLQPFRNQRSIDAALADLCCDDGLSSPSFGGFGSRSVPEPEPFDEVRHCAKSALSQAMGGDDNW